ncbi:hypothetical protein P3X46_030093 [Hevea brasiliensis]|uniref:Uncharacterized protein n=1 Tax=Hevea brasiliensis TaxID=3981 RepID=A0ABQ9KWE6_HEVBR|nr:protein SGT1 homolog A [Hevea brasiliensis]KAJ9147994.1 hypothetical protein P3X46_030093 [Hevea brasiliensis]
MACELAEKAKEAIIDDDFELAVDLYSKAIKLDPTNADYFADRAQAYIKLNNFTEAVADANKAIELASSIAKAYLRKGTACMKLEEYHTAKRALEIGASLAPDDSRFTKLIKECDLHIAEEFYDQRKSLAPNVPLSATPASVGSCKNETISSEKPKYRHEYYQKPEEVVLTIFAKGIPAENVTVDFGEQILSVTINVPGEDTYHFQPQLFGKILPDRSKYQVLSTKIEIHLAKAEVINWTSLEYCKGIIVPQKINVSSVGSRRPSYPSSKSRAKDWDKLEAQVKSEERDEKLDGDAALNKLFRDIYQNADDDMRRAMTKSFVESSGTVLSTDWKEVGSKKVEGSAPEGMVMNKWEY